MAGIHFVALPWTDETTIIRKLQPPALLVSYHYFRTRLLDDFVQVLGYHPILFVDSGAFSAFNTGKVIRLQDYLDWLSRNKQWVHEYVALDVIGDPIATWHNFFRMKIAGYNPIPVYHYGDDLCWLRRYYGVGERRIALGGTVPEHNKTKVAKWVREIKEAYPDVSFHVLGTSSKKVTNICDPEKDTWDSATWSKMAMNGWPKQITSKQASKQASKLERLEYWMRRDMGENESMQLSLFDTGGFDTC